MNWSSIITTTGFSLLFIYAMIKILGFFGVSSDVYGVYLVFIIFVLLCIIVLPNNIPE